MISYKDNEEIVHVCNDIHYFLFPVNCLQSNFYTSDSVDFQDQVR